MNKASSVARGGIYTALSVLLIYFSSTIPTSRITILAVASAMIPLSIVTLDMKSSVMVYTSTSLLSFLLGLRSAAIVYTLFFGLYGFVKFYVERLRKAIAEFILKLVFFNLSLYLMYLLYSYLFLELSLTKLPLHYMLLLFQGVFIVFDYALTIIISYINKHFA